MHAYFCSTLKVGEKWKGNYIMKSHSTMLDPSPDSQHLRKLVFPLSLYHSKNILCAYLNFVPTFFHYTDVLSLNVVHSWTCLMGFFGFWFNKAFYIPRLKMSSVLSQIFDSFGNYFGFHPIWQWFSTSLPGHTGEPQELWKHAGPDCLVRGADLFSLRLSDKETVAANATIVIWCEWIKWYLFFGQIGKNYNFWCAAESEYSQFMCAIGDKGCTATHYYCVCV